MQVTTINDGVVTHAGPVFSSIEAFRCPLLYVQWWLATLSNVSGSSLGVKRRGQRRACSELLRQSSD
jgi:hypothetical protein